MKTKIVWAPQEGPQTSMVQCPLPFVGFGGARGGGKTQGVLGKYAIKAEQYGRRFNACFFRKEMPQQDDLIEEAKEIYLPLGATWHDQKKMFRMPHGGRIRFRPLETVADAEKYQGQGLTDAAVEEAGNYPIPDPILRLFGCLRSKHGVPIQLILTFNPGGSGNDWLRKMFVDPYPPGSKILEWTLPNGKKFPYTFIRSFVRDNKILLERDPEYVNRLYLVGSKELVEAWLNGDFNQIQGAFFSMWDATKHVIPSTRFPHTWARFRTWDWGDASPFCCLWFCVSDGVPFISPHVNAFPPRYRKTFNADDGYKTYVHIPRGVRIVYKEWYGCDPVQTTKGLRMSNQAMAEGIIARSQAPEERNLMTLTDTKPFQSQDGAKGWTIEKVFYEHGVPLTKADTSRVAGWSQVCSQLIGDEDNGPALLMTSNCVHGIALIPQAQHDPLNAQELICSRDDYHDALRYGAMANKIVVDAKIATEVAMRHAVSESHPTIRRMLAAQGSPIKAFR